MPQPKVSVIIPMYNCERYIEKCLESLLMQSASEYEVLIINDGSTDRSESLVKDFIDNNGAKHFRLISKANGGISSARNVGIEEACGDWITFVDADDWVERDFLKSMLDPLENSEADFCISGYYKYFEDTGEIKACYAPQNCCCSRDAAIGVIYYAAPFARMYSRAIVMKKGVRCDERILVGEDRTFNFEYLSHVKTCVMVNERQYIYRIHSSSISYKDVAPSKRKYSFESARRLWLSFSDPSIIENAFRESRYLSESIFDALLWDIICSVLEKDKSLVDVDNDPAARYIVDNYQANGASTKEKVFVFLLKHRLWLLMEIIAKLYYGKRLRRILKRMFHTDY